MTDTTNGWLGKPGVPLNPEKDGWHWVSMLGGKDNAQAMEWLGPEIGWDETDWTTEDFGLHARYLGPCLTPDEATALQARVAELEWLAAYLCGRNTDHIQVALVGNPIVADAVIKRAEAAIKGKKDE
jgi:hypothetical protein